MKLVLCFCSMVLVAACSSDKPDEKVVHEGVSVDGAIAQVGEHFISKADVDAEFLLLPKQYQAKKEKGVRALL